MPTSAALIKFSGVKIRRLASVARGDRMPAAAALRRGFRVRVEIHRARRHDRRDGVLVHHLGHRITEQHDVLVERFNVPLKLDAVDEVDRNRNVLFAQCVQNGSCNNCPLLLMAYSIFLQVDLDWRRRKEIRRQSLHYSRFCLARRGIGLAANPLRDACNRRLQLLSAYGLFDERNSMRNGVPVSESFAEPVFQVTLVRFRHGVERVTVDDDDRRILAAWCA